MAAEPDLNNRPSVKFKPAKLEFKGRLSDGDSTDHDGYLRTPTTPGPSSTGDREKHEKKKIGHRRVDLETGLVTYKKVPTSQLMGAIQLGISNSVGSLASKPERDLLLQDFGDTVIVSFPSEGSHITPSHQYSDFKFKTYAPIAFRYFRELFSIKPEDFLVSLCAEPLQELSNPGASGSIFYISNDDQFIIKTVQHKEAEFLQKLLPGYYMNLNQNPKTLLPKFFGLYCYQTLGKNVRLLVMNNLLPSTIKLHRKYDLKGSTYKRRGSKYEKLKECPTLKDLDFLEINPEGINLDSATYDALMKIISRDCLVLKSFKIMDYSLLIGVHNIDQALREKEAASSRTLSADNIDVGATASTQKDPQLRKIVRQKTVFNTWESVRTDFGEEYPAGAIPASNSKGEHLLLFLGIIDILQSYRFFKKFEHSWKSVLHDGDTISVHHPNFYAQRFQDFMAEKVFRRIHSPLKHNPSRKRGRKPASEDKTKIRSLIYSPSAVQNSNRTEPLTPRMKYFGMTPSEAEKYSTLRKQETFESSSRPPERMFTSQEAQLEIS